MKVEIRRSQDLCNDPQAARSAGHQEKNEARHVIQRSPCAKTRHGTQVPSGAVPVAYVHVDCSDDSAPESESRRAAYQSCHQRMLIGAPAAKGRRLYSLDALGTEFVSVQQ